jgi:phosphatidylglycerophosphatase A
MSVSGPEPGVDTEQTVSFLERLIATGFFSGYSPFASGTAGTLVGLGLCLLPGVHTNGVLIPLTFVVFFVGVYASGRVAAVEGNRLTRSAATAKAVFQRGALRHPDPSIVVIDEIVGMWVSLLWLPPIAGSYVAAFIAFRIFDVLKPEPAQRIEHLPGGWGIMLDDVIAGLYANITVHVLAFLIPKFFAASPIL